MRQNPSGLASTHVGQGIFLSIEKLSPPLSWNTVTLFLGLILYVNPSSHAVWLLHNLVEASIALVRCPWLGSQLLTWRLHPLVSYAMRHTSAVNKVPRWHLLCWLMATGALPQIAKPSPSGGNINIQYRWGLLCNKFRVNQFLPINSIMFTMIDQARCGRLCGNMT